MYFGAAQACFNLKDYDETEHYLKTAEQKSDGKSAEIAQLFG